jgi:chorismate synthase
MDLRFSVSFKPISSILQKQKTVNRRGEAVELLIQGRHDICVGPRAVPVVEAMTALVLADLILLQRCARV